MNTYDYHTLNAGRSHLYGFEVELAHRPNASFDWYASLGHVRTQFDEFRTTLGATNDLAGLEFAYAPKWTFGVGMNVRFRELLIANVNANYRSEMFTDVGDDQSRYRVGARTLVNARIGHDAGYWGAYLVANNLFDEEYVQYDARTLGMAVLGAPRTFGVTLEARF